MYKSLFLKYVEYLVDLGTLKCKNGWKWVSPSFAQHKPTPIRVKNLSEFNNLNSKLNQNPYLPYA